ncbi:MAG: Regulator of RpoS [Candidatus Scalindua arabica]|uniref:Regulator of RpoS n=1 Tax=Candidatus Scalindua arabica TaxID=1127984 RepID=A0A941W7S2_9BACT|nr:Regulator of RpoS [Candidatus Scalindua arabica]
MKRFYTTGDVAHYCEVNVDTVKRWIRQGDLEAFSMPAGHFRVTRSEFIEFLNKHGFPYDEDYFGAAPSQTDILIIDDDEQLVKILSLMLEELYDGIEIESSTDGFDGYLKLCQPSPRLLLLDMRLPGMTGLELLRVMRSRSVAADTKVLVISEYLDKQTVDELKTLDVDGILPKPIEKDDLKKICDTLLNRVPVAQD